MTLKVWVTWLQEEAKLTQEIAACSAMSADCLWLCELYDEIIIISYICLFYDLILEFVLSLLFS